MSGIEWTPIRESFGAMVTGNFVAPLAQDVQSQLRALLQKRRVLVVRGQEITESAQMRIMALLGPLMCEGKSPVSYVSNTREDGGLGSTELAFHSDLGFAPVQYEAISLFATQVEADQTSTMWADAVAAFERMPHSLQDRLRGMHAINVISNVKLKPGKWLGTKPTVPYTRHPIVRRVDAVEYLTTSECQTDHIEGLTQDESGDLLQTIFRYLYDPSNIIEHPWRENDLVIWDNRTTQHARGNIAFAAERTLRRVVTGKVGMAEQFPDFIDQILNVYGRGNAPENA